MSATNFNTKNDTFRKLMGNGLTYQVPRFQRDYSWSEEEWEDLWMDILGTIHPAGEPAHYMGYLVLQSENDKLFDVIDGQQRLTTLSLITLAVLKNLERLVDSGIDADRNRQRVEQIQQTYVGYLDPVTLVPKTKLKLNRNNDHYYQTYIVPRIQLPVRGFRASEHSLRKAFEWFDKKLQEYARGAGPEPGKELARFVESLSDRLFFTVITVTDELNAYKVFETLNARGVRLSATDLLKNYLFSVLHKEGQHEHEMTSLENRWEGMVGRLGSESFPDFLRVHWNSRFSFVRQTDLFKTIRKSLSTKEAVFRMIREMEEDIDTYLALILPENSGWPPSLKSYASQLRMFGVRQPFPLLLACRRVLTDTAFETVLSACAVISFRYNVIGVLPTNEQERVYNATAEKVFKKELTAPGDILRSMASLYPSDQSFRTAFSDKVMRTTQSRNKKVVRYILCEIENRLANKPLDYESDEFNIEHVFPENPSAGWESFCDEQDDTLAYRLGNMTLMGTSANRAASNKPYDEKRPLYQASPFQITRKIDTDNSEWTPARLAARQDWMARQATSIWRIEQLS